jgi:hypothetical protein
LYLCGTRGSVADGKDEFEMNMKLIGAPTIADVVPSMVDTSALNGGAAPDTMFDANCKSLQHDRGDC